jgi:hypothetical protein
VLTHQRNDTEIITLHGTLKRVFGQHGRIIILDHRSTLDQRTTLQSALSPEDSWIDYKNQSQSARRALRRAVSGSHVVVLRGTDIAQPGLESLKQLLQASQYSCAPLGYYLEPKVANLGQLEQLLSATRQHLWLGTQIMLHRLQPGSLAGIVYGRKQFDALLDQAKKTQDPLQHLIQPVQKAVSTDHPSTTEPLPSPFRPDRSITGSELVVSLLLITSVLYATSVAIRFEEISLLVALAVGYTLGGIMLLIAVNRLTFRNILGAPIELFSRLKRALETTLLRQA